MLFKEFMSIKSYIRAFERLPVDTLRYAASTNYFLACAQALPDFSSYMDLTWIPFNAVINVVVTYDDGIGPSPSYLPIAGGTMQGNINMSGHNINNIGNMTLSGATLASGTFADTGYFLTMTINGSALQIPLYKQD